MLSLTSAEAQVRAYTRHTDDVLRLTQSNCRMFLHQSYRWLRTWLQDVAPTLYVCTSDEIALTPPDDIVLSSTTSAFERLYRVEKKDIRENWRMVEWANEVNPNEHAANTITCREESGCLKFYPDDRYEGTYRVKYHFTPSGLTDDASTFHIPTHLELPLVFMTCAAVALADGDDPKDFDKRVSMLLNGDDGKGGARKALSDREGAHPQRSGLQRVMKRW